MKDKNEEKIKLSDFEKNLKRLEEIVAKLEKGEMSLEESLKLFEEGIKLARTCEKALTEAERRVDILIRNEQGEMEARPFVVAEEFEQNESVKESKGNSTSHLGGLESKRKEDGSKNNDEQNVEGDLPF